MLTIREMITPQTIHVIVQPADLKTRRLTRSLFSCRWATLLREKPDLVSLRKLSGKGAGKRARTAEERLEASRVSTTLYLRWSGHFTFAQETFGLARYTAGDQELSRRGVRESFLLLYR